jgi:SAM-dependent methyltransferase
MQRLLEWKNQQARQALENDAAENERLERLRRAKEKKMREAEAKRAEVQAWKNVKRQEVEEQAQQATLLAKQQHGKWARTIRRSTAMLKSSSRLATLARPKGVGALPRVQHEERAKVVGSSTVQDATRPNASPLQDKALRTCLDNAGFRNELKGSSSGAQLSLDIAQAAPAAESATGEPASITPQNAETDAMATAKAECKRQKQKEELRLWRQQQEENAAKASAKKEKREKARLQAWKDRAKALRDEVKQRAGEAAAAKAAAKPAPPELPPEFRVQRSRTADAFSALRRDFERDLSGVILAEEPEPAPQHEREPEPEPQQASNVLARYKVVAATVKFTVAFSIDSEVAGQLTKGEIVEVAQIRRNARGQTRLRLHQQSPAIRINEEGNSVEAEAWVSEASWPHQTPMLELVPPEKRKGGASDFQFREGGGDGTAWDKRFLQQVSEGEGRTDEWYICYENSPELQQFMQAAIDPDALVVQVGCGNSRMAPALYKDGFKYLINLDISKAVLAHMQMRYSKTHPGLAFIAADATQTCWPSEIVDVIVDKGTLQSLLLLRDGVARVEAFAREMWRILRPGGKMIQIMGSAGMQMYLKLPDLRWGVKHKVIPRDGIGGKANVFTFIKPVQKVLSANTDNT